MTVDVRERHARARMLAVAGLALLLAGASSGQTQPAAPGGASLNELVIEWMRGNYASPLVCMIDGKPQRGLRRILAQRAPRERQHSRGVVRFVDLEAENATRCFTEIGGPTPNITGELEVRHPVTKRRDTAMRDFKTELKRKRGFELDIVSGRLELVMIGGDREPETLELRGGKLRIHLLRTGSDAMRLLQDLPSPRKVVIEIESKSGRVLSFPASLAKPKGQRQ
ncbi:MAG: hypothetical protein GY944_00180 [bacterium]|nr:hypothetical protein [bacterium]